jgi:hypothetical protein
LWRGSEFDAVAEASEFPDHLGRPPLRPFPRDRRAAFLVHDALVQDLPDQPTETMRDGSDGLGVPQAREQTTIHELEDTAFRLHGRIRGLIEHPSHLAVAVGRAVAVVHACGLFIAGTGPHPRGQMLGGGKRGPRDAHFRDDLLRRIHAQPGYRGASSVHGAVIGERT